MAHSTITSKGQITIPKIVRSRLNLKTGDRVDFKIQNGMLMLVPVSRSVSEVFGMLSGKKRKKYSVEQMNRQLKKQMSDRNK